jgi:hypothetical protein
LPADLVLKIAQEGEVRMVGSNLPANFPEGNCTSHLEDNILAVSPREQELLKEEENRQWRQRYGRNITEAERAEEIKKIISVIDRVPAGAEFLRNVRSEISALPRRTDWRMEQAALTNLAVQIQARIDLVAEQDNLTEAIKAEYAGGAADYAERARTLNYRRRDVTAQLAVQQDRIFETLDQARRRGEAGAQAHQQEVNEMVSSAGNLALSIVVNVFSAGVGVVTGGTGFAGFAVSTVVGGALNYGIGGGSAAATNTGASSVVELSRQAIPRGTTPQAMAVSIGADAVAAAFIQSGLDTAIADPKVAATAAEAVARERRHNGDTQ